MKVKWKGVFPAVTIKFTKDGKLDISGFLKTVHAQLAAGVNGIILKGMVGEASTLPDEEKITLPENGSFILIETR